jgi:hypothetical protein
MLLVCVVHLANTTKGTKDMRTYNIRNYTYTEYVTMYVECIFEGVYATWMCIVGLL